MDRLDALGWLLAAGLAVATGAWCREMVRVLKHPAPFA